MSEGEKIGCSPIPCSTCPYRKDVPSGVWHEDEYAKLPAYDRPTFEQPGNLFMCHQKTGGLCTGWVQSHANREHCFDLLALRFNYRKFDHTVAAVAQSEPKVPLFTTGAEAARHGMKDIKKPGRKTKTAMKQLVKKRKGVVE